MHPPSEANVSLAATHAVWMRSSFHKLYRLPFAILINYGQNVLSFHQGSDCKIEIICI